MTEGVSGLERRVLVLAPVGKDAELIAETLHRARVMPGICRSTAELLRELARGAGAVALAEEALSDVAPALMAALAQQPPWSDLPVMILTRTGADSEDVGRALGTLGNVTLLERPVRVSALLSAVHSALRARDRQYQSRAYLAERDLANERKDQFLATLAHELRNPLAPVRNSLHILRLTGTDPSTQKYCEIMERQVDQLVRLVDDLLDVSRITRGKIELVRQAVDLAQVIATAVETSRPLIDDAGHSLTVELPTEPVTLDADAVRLSQVFSNLLNNAAKYSNAGGHIELRARGDENFVEVAICDDGIGIAREALEGIFDMFVQANPGDNRARSGLGIGLTLARTLVELHGGSIAVASEGLGKGCRFTVRLPVGVAGTRAPSAPAQPRSVPRLRILVVDDNRDAAETLAALLRALGADVRAVYGGEAALALVGEFQPRVCLLDLGMPIMDGYELARRLRARDDLPDTTLIALSGWGQPGAREQARVAGFDHHLTKPVDRHTLLGLLASLETSTPPLEVPLRPGARPSLA